MIKYHYVQDPGHGWLGVPLTELDTLAIRDRITSFSYLERPRQLAWLEEDRDMSTFLQAKAAQAGHPSASPERTHWLAQFMDTQVQAVHTNRTHIRALPSFS